MTASSIATATRNPPLMLPGDRHVRGSILRNHMRWAEENRSPSEIALVWSELPPQMRVVLESFVVSSAWYPYDWLVMLDRRLTEMFEGDREDLAAELGRYAARVDLSPVYRLLHADGPKEFLRRHALRMSHFYDFVTASWQAESRNEGTMVLRQHAPADEMLCRSIRGYCEQALWSHGSRRATVEEIQCQGREGRSCSFRMTWS